MILLIGDDHGYPDFGFTGSPHVRTPNLDELAAEGTVFRAAHNTSSYCRPSLFTLFSGVHLMQWNSWLARSRAAGLEALRQLPTLPRLLADKGYRSFQGGKFWEDSYQTGGFTHGMTESTEERWAGGEGLKLGRETMDPLYEFIEAHEDDPFFVWFAPPIPHVPHDPPQHYMDMYADAGLSPAAAAYYASCTWFDDLVGDLVGYLEERGLRERTILVYVSDNGWDQRPFEDRAGPFGGPRGKHTLYDLGFRTPVVLNWPGEIAAGEIIDEPVSTLDLVPTILSYVNVDPPDHLTGASLRPLMEGSASREHSSVVGRMTFYRVPPARPHKGRAAYVRDADWHLVSYEDRREVELYDIRADPLETNDVSSQHPELVSRYRDQIEQWKREVIHGFSFDGFDRSGRQDDDLSAAPRPTGH